MTTQYKSDWYWGKKNTIAKQDSSRFLFIKFIIDNFKRHGYINQYKYLLQHSKLLENELLNLRNFFKEINKICETNYSNYEKIKLISNIKGPKEKKIITKEVATIIFNSYQIYFPNNKTQQLGGSKKDNYIKQTLKKDFRYLRNYIKEGGNNSIYDSKIYDQLQVFKNMNNQNNQIGIETNINKILKLNEIPKVLNNMINNEYKIPLNLNDILLTGFSLFPNIGWIFDFFLIFRSLLEKRFVFAILLSINCYQYLFYKLISFGFLGMDFGPIIKLFYLAPYVNKDFNFENLKLKINEFMSNIGTSFNKELNIL